MLARMYWKKVVSRGEQYYQITKLENFKHRDELPEKYTSHAPHMYTFVGFIGESILHIQCPTTLNRREHMMISQYALLTEQEKKHAIHWMKICGQRLASINKKLAIKNADWTGEGFDEI